jgi:putative transposase
VDALCAALWMPRATYYRHQAEKFDVIKTPVISKNSLEDAEKKIILDLSHSERFIDKTAYQMYHTLLDEGIYHGSVSTIYRILQSKNETRERRILRNHRDAVKPELIATRPNEVWSWDITKLLTFNKWSYFYLYVILDIYSRLVVGWLLADRESQDLAKQLIEKTALKHGIMPHQLTLHADNGPCMTAHSVSQLFIDLGIAKTHNRPYTSNDNPFSESQFKSMKYCPEFPGRLATEGEWKIFLIKFFNWYCKEHFHSGIHFLTPETVHYGNGNLVLESRHKTLLAAYQKNQIRFNNKIPILKKLPEAVYINPPLTVKIASKK